MAKIGIAALADAVTQNLDIISRYKAEYVVILAGDHIYKQDYSRMLILTMSKKGARSHRAPACRCPLKRHPPSASWRSTKTKIIEFVEKTRQPAGDADRPDQIAGQHGIYAS